MADYLLTNPLHLGILHSAPWTWLIGGRMQFHQLEHGGFVLPGGAMAAPLAWPLATPAQRRMTYTHVTPTRGAAAQPSGLKILGRGRLRASYQAFLA